MKRLIIYFTLLFFIPCPAFAGQYDSLKIIKVIDGDTLIAIEVTTGNEYNIQLLGIDAPEILSDEPFSTEAKKYIEKLILNKTVKARYCYEVANQFYFEIYLDNSFDLSQTLNYLLVQEGLAKIYIDKPLKCSFNESGYQKAEEKAKRNKKGIWSVSNNIK